VGDLADAGVAGREVRPDGIQVIADRAHDAHAGDDHSPVVVSFAHWK
jgi:hypothetical protein